MAKYKDFLEEINVVLPGVARPIVTPAIERVVREFCESSKIWRTDITLDIDNAMSKAPIDLTTLARKDIAGKEAELVDVVTLRVDDEALPYNAFERIARKGFVFTHKSPRVGQYTITVSLTPERGACDIPDFLIDDWAVDIAYGVAYRLAMQPNQSWSNPQIAQEYKRLYIQGKNRAMFEANNQRQSMRDGKYTFY